MEKCDPVYLLVLLLWVIAMLQARVSPKRIQDDFKLKIKLVDGESENEGFLIIRREHGWFYQCQHFWGLRNSKVACRELGFAKVVATQNASTNLKQRKIAFDGHALRCESNERSLWECAEEPVRDEMISKHCSNHTRVFIVCDENKDEDKLIPTSKSFKKLRLHDGIVEDTIIKKGFLQVQFDDQWKDLCGDGWTAENSLVACKHLGFPKYLNSSYHGNGNTDIAYFPINILCSGTEKTLWDCRQNEVLRESCPGRQSIMLECLRNFRTETNELRLRGGYIESEGRVEIFKDGEWGTVCDDGWDIEDAAVVCRQLGFGSPFEATHWSEHGQGIGKIAITNVSCFGNETSMKECMSSSDTSSCTHDEDAGVRCRIPLATSREEIRLVGGTTFEGRVEINRNGRWEGICGIGFTRREGQIVCRQLGLGFVEWATRSYGYGINYRKSMFDVRCRGNETNLLQCAHKEWGKCRYYDMASVKCSKFAADLVMDILEFRKSIIVESNTLRQLKCSYEERCLAPIVDTFYNEYRLLKRKLLKFTSSFMNKGAVSFRPHLEKDAWKWHSCHEHFHSMETFAVYDLIDNNGTKVADGHKASFCLEDTKCAKGYLKHFNCTDKGDQGISVNCVDVYSNRLDCQWIDITEVKDGNYSLRVEVNPLRSVTESDYFNNRAVCALQYFHGEVKVKHCTSDPCYQESFGGNSYGHCCTFPFIYKGEIYNTCTTAGEVSNRAWCATTHHFEEDGRWGYCKQHISSAMIE